jgi:uncharacterized iron-regulated protein
MSFKRTALAIFALLAAAALGCGEGAADTISIRDVRTKQETTLERILPQLADADIVLLGELHHSDRSHRLQLEVIQAMHESGVPVAVGLEMFQHQDQEFLDRWVSGAISEEEFKRAFERNWGHGWGLYREIFVSCRELSIPMVGLNVPREITRQVAAHGFESLTDEQVGQLPPVSCVVDPEYRALLKRVLGAHGTFHGSEADFETFCEAQVLWDTAMAFYAVEYLKGSPQRTMLLLCGAVHAWRPAIPTQVARMDKGKAQVVFLPRGLGTLTPEDITPGDADFLYE